MPNEALSGAASGAATGASVAGPYGAVIGGAVGALSGFMSGRRRRAAAQKERRRQDRIRSLASPQHLADVMKSLTPMFREIVASGLGPQFQAMTADALAKHGMTGTGVGEAMRGASASAPAIFATQAAGAEAGNVVGRELAAEGMAGPAAEGGQNPLLDALMGGARGFMAGGGGSGFRRPGSTPVDYGPAGIMTGQTGAPNGLPNITPEQDSAARHGVPSVFAR